MELRFEWDPEKARANLAKHGVSFEETRAVFYDPLELVTRDSTHSVAEERWFSIGMGANHRLLVACYSEHGDTIRIISARLPTRHERREYEEGQD